MAAIIDKDKRCDLPQTIALRDIPLSPEGARDIELALERRVKRPGKKAKQIAVEEVIRRRERRQQ